ncbi:LysR family transcriptional regulator [Pseudomonas sp. TTU2014-080ASC]|uniref:LysR family transcriptional regulator n=1 Tax=Pseudomonas sp. TTU2014-080ASC TaxID=1729724 RepID=UPI000718A985|nr:LysR family transcriptional regulator [Pseudomonas sp. TTU2014-080ASC]KRW62109.1 transcriptional regulator [Pseudomonas sp. TTU2014-080ASC]
MDLRQLRYFLALNEHRSFVRAADAMGITQPAFSRSIQGLEHEFGCQLVDRGSKDLHPTPEGRVVLQHALALVRGASNLTNEINQMTKLDAGELQFGCGPALSEKLVPDALLHFMQRYPHIHTRLRVDNWESLSRSLGRDEIEFFIADVRQFESDPSLQIRLLRPRSGLFFCRPGHPLLEKESQSTNDLFDYPLAAARLPAGIHKVLANLSGKTQLDQHIECEHLPLLLKLVRSSNTIAMSTQEAMNDYLHEGEFVQLHLRNLPADLDSLKAHCGIVSRAGYRLSPAANAMIELLVKLDQEADQSKAA